MQEWLNALLQIDPVAIRFGPIAIRWYGVAYASGILGGFQLAKHLTRKHASFGFCDRHWDGFTPWAVLGIVVGGRLGSVLLYNLEHYLAHPAEIFQIWNGGMSFHGGLAGVILASLWYTRRESINRLAFLDVAACVAPLGLFLGRVANFINGELWGRPTSQPWGVVFPSADTQARHPSQLYEACLEGVALLMILHILARTPLRTRPGFLGAVFLIGYGVARFSVEFTREPDAALILSLTRGQAFSLPMVLIGVWLMRCALGRPTVISYADPAESARRVMKLEGVLVDEAALAQRSLHR